MQFYRWPPNYDCKVTVDGEVRVVRVRKQFKEVQRALTLFTMASRLGLNVPQKLKDYIKAHSEAGDHGTEAVKRF